MNKEQQQTKYAQHYWYLREPRDDHPEGNRLESWAGIQGHAGQLGGWKPDNLPRQIVSLQNLIKENNVEVVIEIGFNLGHSSVGMLESSEGVTITSFDIVASNAVLIAKNHVDSLFEGRHKLIQGSSFDTIPEYVSNYKKSVDLIFIDGCHTYEGASTDLINCKELANENTIVALDDWTSNPAARHTEGPTQAWNEMVADGRILQLKAEDYVEGKRGMSWGKYNIK